jgi:hypothetical protein
MHLLDTWKIKRRSMVDDVRATIKITGYQLRDHDDMAVSMRRFSFLLEISSSYSTYFFINFPAPRTAFEGWYYWCG